MKKSFKKILILVMAVVCVCSIQITVSAQPSIGNGSLGNIFEDWINGMLTSLNPNNTTAPSTENTTATTDPADNTTTDPNAQATDPINNSGTGTVASTTESTVYYPPVNNTQTNTYPVPQITTTEPAGDDEMSFTYDSSLSGLLEADSAAVIVQNPAETQYTLGGIVVNNNNTKNDVFSWQKIALIAAAGLFVVLSALVVALLIQRSKKDDDKGSGVRTDYESDAPSGPVAVEVMTAERIAELLGSAPGKQRANIDSSNLTSEDSAAAIKTAALMGQLNSYSDPLIRKYTEEPVRFSPLANVGSNGDVTGAEILQATDSMLDDITGNEKYAADTSGLYISTDNFEDLLEDTEIKICPECQSPVTSGDVFCHTCGAYVG